MKTTQDDIAYLERTIRERVLATPEPKACRRCRGTGSIMVRGMDRPTSCPACAGTGSR